MLPAPFVTLLLSLAALALALAALTEAQENFYFYVHPNDGIDAGNDCRDDAAPCKTLQQAVSSAISTRTPLGGFAHIWLANNQDYLINSTVQINIDQTTTIGTLLVSLTGQATFDTFPRIRPAAQPLLFANITKSIDQQFKLKFSGLAFIGFDGLVHVEEMPNFSLELSGSTITGTRSRAIEVIDCDNAQITVSMVRFSGNSDALLHVVGQKQAVQVRGSWILDNTVWPKSNATIYLESKEFSSFSIQDTEIARNFGNVQLILSPGDEAEVVRSSFHNNTRGPALYVKLDKQVDVSVIGSQFYENTSPNGIDTCGMLVERNCAASECVPSSIRVHSTVFRDHSGRALEVVPGINAQYLQVNITKSQFVRNGFKRHVFYGEQDGGALSVRGHSDLTIDSTTFDSNEALYGGAILVDHSVNFILRDSLLMNNFAVTCATIYSVNNNFMFFRQGNVTFLNNHAQDSKACPLPNIQCFGYQKGQMEGCGQQGQCVDFDVCQCTGDAIGKRCERRTCQQGQYWDILQKSCTYCKQGTYSNTRDALECTRCKRGTYCAGSGCSNCQDCPRGKFAEFPGSIDCNDCPFGTYTDTPGSVNCTLCKKGTYTAEFRSTACKPCDIGQYQNLEGQSQCKQCASGYSDKKGALYCAPCPVGYVADGQRAMCILSPGWSWFLSIAIMVTALIVSLVGLCIYRSCCRRRRKREKELDELSTIGETPSQSAATMADPIVNDETQELITANSSARMYSTSG